MSFFSKFFKSTPKDDFILHSIQFQTPQSQTLTDGDYVWAIIDFESRYDCQLWMMSQTKEEQEAGECLIDGGYMPSDVLLAGRHTIERYFYLNDINAKQYPNGVTVNGADICVQTSDGDNLYHQVHHIHYVYKPLSLEALAERQKADTENLKINFVSVRYDGNILSPNDAISIDSQITVRIQVECNENVYFSCGPITDLPYGFDPLSEPVDGLLDLNFNMNDTGSISGLMIKAYNRYNIAIDSLQVDFLLTVEDWHNDGKNQPVRFEFDYLYDSVEAQTGGLDIIKERSVLPHNKDFNLFMYLNHQAKHGVVLWVYDMIDGKISEQIFKSFLQTYDECQEENYNPSFLVNWEDVDFLENPIRKVSGFYLQLTNVAGDVLAEQTVDFALTIRQFS